MLKKYINKYGLPLVIVGLLGKLTSIIFVFGIYGHWFSTLMPDESENITIYLDPENTLEEYLITIEDEVTKSGGHGERLSRTLSWRGWGERIKPGKYVITVGKSIGEVAQKLATGDRESVRVIVPAGRDLDVIAGKIATRIAADSSDVLKLIRPDSIRWKIIPNTYEMWWETNAEGAVARLIKESKIWWNTDRLEKAKSKGISDEEAVILASIVQAETAVLSEAPIVAGLYLNRLDIGQLLQADPTLIYAWDDDSITRVLDIHKEIDSPYNTYKNTGLPPGTIRIPEPTYIDAVLNATEHDYLYMCAEPGGTGKHSFARRYREHIRNARKYQKWLNKQHIYR
ncbi:MAG: endolytic transglycosylase MltG [Flavobacteriales bacterium]|jgi:UPF0755 protein|nr:endolytic transglycosylase MltG [Flavobacteriales bacterium]MBT6175276.1 endolytic transglycosylase MltG [Flavobacteriales bacterium]